MTKATREQAQKIESKAGAPIQFIVAHFVRIGEQVAEALTCEQINAVYKSEKAKQQEAEKRGSIYFITPELSKAILEGCYLLAFNPSKKDIIKAYI